MSPARPPPRSSDAGDDKNSLNASGGDGADDRLGDDAGAMQEHEGGEQEEDEREEDEEAEDEDEEAED